MKLTSEEQEMLSGNLGYPKQKSMEILVAMGECYEAEKMLPITSVHLSGASIISAGRAGAAFAKKLADEGGEFVPFTDTNMTLTDPNNWKDLGIPEASIKEDLAHHQSLGRMGAMLCNSCTPYLLGNVPGIGEHIAWGESSAIIFANSVLGARTNREGGPGALASALTGRTPAYGSHLDENRLGDFKIIVDIELDGIVDYGALGYYAGKIAGDKVPVFVGLPPTVSWDELKTMGAAAATSGGVVLYHVVGRTPEAATEKEAFGSKKIGPAETFVFGAKELAETTAALSSAEGPAVDMIVVGCPNASIAELKEIATMLGSQNVKPGTRFWVMTSEVMRSYAQKMGYLDTIESAGGKIICGTCPSGWPRGTLRQNGINTVATNSPKMAFYVPATQDLQIHFGSTSRCVEAAINGIWR